MLHPALPNDIPLHRIPVVIKCLSIFISSPRTLPSLSGLYPEVQRGNLLHWYAAQDTAAPPASLSGLRCHRWELSRRSNDSRPSSSALCFLCTNYVFRAFFSFLSQVNCAMDTGSSLVGLFRIFALFPLGSFGVFVQPHRIAHQACSKEHSHYRNTPPPLSGDDTRIQPTAQSIYLWAETCTNWRRNLPSPRNLPSYPGVGRGGELPHMPTPFAPRRLPTHLPPCPTHRFSPCSRHSITSTYLCDISVEVSLLRLPIQLRFPGHFWPLQLTQK